MTFIHIIQKRRIPMNSDKKMARVAGLLYLILIIAGIFAEGYVRQSLIVPGDAAATANHIMASEGLFRTAIAGDLIMILCDIALSVIFYLLLRPVSNALSLLAAFFRLAQAATLGINLLNLFFVLQLLHGADYLNIFSADQLHALVLLFFNAHGIGYAIGLVFFGVYLLLLGYLMFKSGYFPRILGILLIIAALSYLTDSFTSFLFPGYAAITAQLMVAPTVIAELSLTLWLLIKGVKVQPGEDSTPATTAQVEATAA
jgi:hypothetical protein